MVAVTKNKEHCPDHSKTPGGTEAETLKFDSYKDLEFNFYFL